MSDYSPVIGLEIHVELKTQSKMFCGCKNDPFHAPSPNIYTCPVCLGMPGALPVPNRRAVEWTIKLGLALGCTIAEVSKFDRKNYFYPDLPKGYQISQYDQPLCVNGSVEAEHGVVGITRVHLEEDTGKLLHKTVDGEDVTLIDFNRSGVPLVEIVTEPDIKDGEHAKMFLKQLRQIIVDLCISDAQMQEGSMRLEPNISVRTPGETALPSYKVEVKNINSFTFAKRAIEYEIDRHIELLKKGEIPKQETRGWNEDKNISVPQRSKEEAADYRYFPEPDIPPMRFTQEEIAGIGADIPELPAQRLRRFVGEYGMSDDLAALATTSLHRTKLLDETIALAKSSKSSVAPKVFADWVINKKIDEQTIVPREFVSKVVSETTVEHVDDEVAQRAVESVLSAHPQAVADYKGGKESVVMFLFGQLMRELKGKGDKTRLQKLLQDALQQS